MENSRRTASIHILDDDSLIHVFRLYRPFLLGEDEDDDARFLGGMEGWVHARWWYGLAHVCQRWRNVVLGSASYLGVSLVCTYGTPVADMLAHSPPLPLAIDYRIYRHGDHDITGDEEGGLSGQKAEHFTNHDMKSYLGDQSIRSAWNGSRCTSEFCYWL